MIEGLIAFGKEMGTDIKYPVEFAALDNLLRCTFGLNASIVH